MGIPSLLGIAFTGASSGKLHESFGDAGQCKAKLNDDMRPRKHLTFTINIIKLESSDCTSCVRFQFGS